MIARLRGSFIEASDGKVVLECGGVGYEVLVPESTLLELPLIGEELLLHTRHIVREDGQFLVGFTVATERKLFDMLVEVKGCGPKVALAIIGSLGAATTLAAIATEDPRTLAKASGVGPKLAERIILELKEKARQQSLVQKIDHALVGAPTKSKPGNEIVDALLSLGYRRQEAEEAADSVLDSTLTVEDQLKLALRKLSR